MLNCKIVFLFKNIDNDKIMKFLIILIIPIKVNRWGGKTPDYACSILAVTIILIILYPYFWVSDETSIISFCGVKSIPCRTNYL